MAEEKRITRENLIKIHDALYEIPQDFDPAMRVPARVFANEKMLDDILGDRSLSQIVNVATLPGIQQAALAMPDIHEGYGFPIGGVAATAIHENGVISPGGIGYDINCGVRLLSIDISAADAQPHIERFSRQLFDVIPSGVGKGGELKFDDVELDKILTYGARRMLELGYGEQEDLDFCEAGGALEADVTCISDKARGRGRDQLGTLGSGNHFLEIQRVDEIFDPATAEAFGLKEGMLVAMIHCGSRGLGHQTCTEYVRTMLGKLESWGITLPDPELACAPFLSAEGQHYFNAMNASANFAWANRHLIGHWVRETVASVFGSHVSVKTVYDICHNIGKQEKHTIDGVVKDVLVHRKGATRAFPAHHPELKGGRYFETGHPVFVPGTMGTSSYVLVGKPQGMRDAFGSCCHGAGRRMSRSKARKQVHGKTLREQLRERGIIIQSRSDIGLAEEAPLAYKDVDNVVSVIREAGIASTVARLKPMAVVKGD